MDEELPQIVRTQIRCKAVVEAGLRVMTNSIDIVRGFEDLSVRCSPYTRQQPYPCC